MAIKCPKCNERDIRRSHRRLYDIVLRGIGLVPLRCNICERRFYRFRRSLHSHCAAGVCKSGERKP